MLGLKINNVSKRALYLSAANSGRSTADTIRNTKFKDIFFEVSLDINSFEHYLFNQIMLLHMNVFSSKSISCILCLKNLLSWLQISLSLNLIFMNNPFNM